MHDDKKHRESMVYSLPLERAKINFRHLIIQWTRLLRSFVDDAETICTMQGHQAFETAHRHVDELDHWISNLTPFDVNSVELLERLQLVKNSFDALYEAIKPSGPHPITTTFVALARPAAEGASDEPGPDHLQRIGPTGSIRKCGFDNNPNDNSNNLVSLTAGNSAVAAGCAPNVPNLPRR